MASNRTTDRATQLAKNFAELEPRYTNDEAVAEAARCLFCYDAPCARACPTHIDVPRFIRQILHKNPVGAAETILDANIFGGSCARACPTEVLCEGACVDNTLLKAPVRIGRLQRYACDAAADKKIRFFESGQSTGKHVAIVGAGPAGLTCAHELRKHGHAVTIHEARELPGGINTHGIAVYKYDTAFALSEVEQVKAIGGIDIRLNSRIDGPGVARLLEDHDAVFLAVGLGRTAQLDIPGEDLPGVWEALDFIFQTHTKPLDQCECGRHVLVIGGGNTAVDVATAAVRLGAEKVTIVYRRSHREMPAFKYEYELTRSDGIDWIFSAAPLRILSGTGVGPAGGTTPRAVGIECVRTRQSAEGRASRLENIPGSEFTLEADMIVKALGQEPLMDLLRSIPGLKVENGRVSVDRATGATSIRKLFAGGDCISKGAEVVDAVQEGKIAARGIHAMLTA
ncbi:MAG: NAD(P)-dependent oxidoreductase [Phycisphaerae bacterium]|nr:NAD(P)-dependent oxidoreductase [Phycisphaerae bacterium]